MDRNLKECENEMKGLKEEFETKEQKYLNTIQEYKETIDKSLTTPTYSNVEDLKLFQLKSSRLEQEMTDLRLENE